LFAKGHVLNIFPLRIVYDNQINGAALRAGFSVSKKKFKKAVERNRIKRLLREAWRLNSPNLKEHLEKSQTNLAVFILYVGDELPDFSAINTSVQQVIMRLTMKV